MSDGSPKRTAVSLPTAAAWNDEPLSLEDVFRAHARSVGSLAFRLMGRDDEVNDVVQDVFFHAMGKLKQLRDPAAVRGWLATVTLRMVRRRLRVRRVKGFLGLEATPPGDQLIAPGVSPDDRALLGQVYQALDDLPVNDRLAWVLRHVEGEQLDDVARLCGCSLATAKRRIAAAQAALDEVIADD